MNGYGGSRVLGAKVPRPFFMYALKKGQSLRCHRHSIVRRTVVRLLSHFLDALRLSLFESIHLKAQKTTGSHSKRRLVRGGALRFCWRFDLKEPHVERRQLEWLRLAFRKQHRFPYFER